MNHIALQVIAWSVVTQVWIDDWTDTSFHKIHHSLSGVIELCLNSWHIRHCFCYKLFYSAVVFLEHLMSVQVVIVVYSQLQGFQVVCSCSVSSRL